MENFTGSQSVLSVHFDSSGTKMLEVVFFPSFSPRLKHSIAQISLKGLFLKILSTHTSLFILFKHSVCAVGGPLSERSKIHRISK